MYVYGSVCTMCVLVFCGLRGQNLFNNMGYDRGITI